MSIIIRTVKNSDLDFLFSCYSDLNSNYLWLQDRQINSEKEFYNYFFEKIHQNSIVFFIIEKSDTNIPIGFTYLNKVNLIDGIGYLTLYLTKEHRMRSFGYIAGLEFIDYIFNTYPIRKLYSEVFSYNKDSMNIHKRSGFTLECTLKDYRYFKNKYWDVCIFSLSRQFLKSSKIRVEK